MARLTAPVSAASDGPWLPSTWPGTQRLTALWAWLTRRPRRGLVVALAIGCLFRLPFLTVPFGDDEGGYLYVAQHWSDGGHWLYGSQWVDRPPVLVLVFRAVAALGGTPVAMRLVAMAFACALVAGAWYAGRAIAGANGAVGAAIVAAALVSNPAILGNELVSDELGASFEVVSFALLLAACAADGRRPWRSGGIAALAGVAGVLAFLCKQSALVALVLAVVLLGAALRRRWRLLLAYAVGVVVPLLAVLLWAARGPGIGMLLDATWFFRVGAARVVATSGSHAPEDRLWSFLAVMVVSGMVIPLVHLGWDMVTRRGTPGLRATVALAAGCTGAVIAASLNWYSYYWLAVVPLAALGIAVSFVPGPRTGRRRLHPELVVAATLALGFANVAVRLPAHRQLPPVSRYLAAAAHARDTMIVVWGQPNLMEDAGLSTPYPYSWSLPVRVEDPHLRLFTRVLAGPRAPTWLLEVGSFDDWHLETPRLRAVLRDRYRVAAVVCGHPIWLRDGTTRPLASAAGVAARSRCRR